MDRFSSKRHLSRIAFEVEVSSFEHAKVLVPNIVRAGVFPCWLDDLSPDKSAPQAGGADDLSINKLTPSWGADDRSKNLSSVNIIVGRDTNTKLFTNLAGHCNQTNTSIYDEMNRECEEESLGLLSLDPTLLDKCVTAHAPFQYVTFYMISKSKATKLLTDFPLKVKEQKSSELSSLVSMQWDEFWKIVQNNSTNELKFRPVSVLLAKDVI